MRANFCLKKATLAAAISLATGVAWADALPRGKVRIELNDTISSLPDKPIQAEEDRISFNGLIQSHPDPLYLALEERYQALPPFTAASEDIPEQLIAEASLQERVSERITNMARGLPRYMPRVSSYVRYDDVSKSDFYAARSTYLATVNPSFEYNRELKKWQVAAGYDYRHNRYMGDLNDSFGDHQAKMDWTLKMSNRGELQINSLYSNKHDQELKDPIEDFDSALRSEDLEERRYLVNVGYRRGTLRDRTRYNVFYATEKMYIDDASRTDYSVDRQIFGGAYTWQARRQLAMVAEGRYENYDYDLVYRDNDHYQALVGPDVMFGRRIKARVRVGYESKKFEESIMGSTFGKPVWRGSVEWALRRKTSVNVETGREIYEDANIDEVINTASFNVRDWVRTSWKEKWSDRLTTEASYTFRDTSLTGQGPRNSQSARQLLISAAFRLTDKILFAFDSAFTREENLRRRTFTIRTDYSL